MYKVIFKWKNLIFSYLFFLVYCSSVQKDSPPSAKLPEQTPDKVKIQTGAERTDTYFPQIENKTTALVANHTSLVNNIHLVDTLLSSGIHVKRIFSPEHGFRGKADAGEYLDNSVDSITGLPIISLYGPDSKPANKYINDLDIIIFDIQDVGVRFYTYISTMHQVMQSCAENNVQFIVLDRPNPNGFYVDGPVLNPAYQSFVGMHPVPIVHGMTIGEYAGMINGEYWLEDSLQCQLSVIKCLHYTHDSLYHVTISPSPNLKDMTAIYLYPSLGLFEGTIISVGRGTEFPFKVFGHPGMKKTGFSFIPVSMPGSSKHPKHENKECHGIDLRDIHPREIREKGLTINYLKYAYQHVNNNKSFFNLFFYNLAGNKELKDQVISNKSDAEIKISWKNDLEKFKKIRKKYLLYPDFTE